MFEDVDCTLPNNGLLCEYPRCGMIITEKPAQNSSRVNERMRADRNDNTITQLPIFNQLTCCRNF